MALTLEIEFLSGVSYAALGPEGDAPDWPPQPDRVFSALVATWAAHGQPADERRALEWLERLSVPRCEADKGAARTAPIVFVPPNDPSVQRAKLANRVLPALRNRQPRRFPAARLKNPVVRHHWSDEPDDATLNALDGLARDTSYVGHSCSLTRCRFSRSAPAAEQNLKWPQRRIYPGRLQELCAAYARFEHSADKKDRPASGGPVTPRAAPLVPSGNMFSDRWLVLEHLDGEMRDLRAAALIARGIRVALMSGYGRVGVAVPLEISGHEVDGSPTRRPHLAVVPLAFTGFEHADGRVLGFALVPPAASALLDDPLFMKVLRHLTRPDATLERRVLEVKSSEGTPRGQAFALQFAPAFEPPPGRRSLHPVLYTGRAHHFATVTPIALDRHPKSRGAARQIEIAKMVAAACMRIGLPEPDDVRVDKHATPAGVPSAYPSGEAPDWTRWRLPESLAGRPLTHALIRFKEPVQGPVLLGAGRFVGLGLCRALDRRDKGDA